MALPHRQRHRNETQDEYDDHLGIPPTIQRATVAAAAARGGYTGAGTGPLDAPTTRSTIAPRP